MKKTMKMVMVKRTRKKNTWGKNKSEVVTSSGMCSRKK
jgi:hypothetical protein